MRCDEIQARYLAGESDDAIVGHLGSCPACRSAAPGLDELRQTLREPVMWETPPPHLGERVVEAVLAEARPPVADHRRRSRLISVAAVAVTVVLIGFGWVALQDRPDWELALDPVEPATGSVVVRGWNTEAGTRMVLDVSGLEHLSDGYYQLWLTAPDGRHISAGTFRADGSVVLWAGVPRSEFPRLWITVEPLDDHDPGPSSHVVFDMDA